MSVKPIIPSINLNNNKVQIKNNSSSSNNLQKKNVSFRGGSPNIIVGMMDAIESGGYPASFIILFTSLSKTRESAPSHLGSVSGK